MAYKARTGITMIQVCGQNMLVASRPVWEKFPRVRPIPKAWAVCWALMQNGRTDEEAVRSFAELFKRPEEEVAARFGKIYGKLAEEGYLVEVPESNDEVAEAESTPGGQA